MNTPAHVVLNLVALNKRDDPRHLHLAVFIGAIAPDAPMFWFYFYEKIILRAPEHVIWSERYYDSGWQNFFDCFNSLPIIALLALAAWWFGQKFLIFLAASMALHVAGDLPLHHDDGHRHFWPLSEWRFESPVSYWDTAHHGDVVMWIEGLLVVLGCLWLIRRFTSWWGRAVPLAVLLAYGSYIGYALVVWVGMDP
ncbi:MAG: hypothetical protein AAF493_09005 [Pseudomonadota bacterium]